jgi:phage repressor protein C with HTH and peptisase S24 domain
MNMSMKILSDKQYAVIAAARSPSKAARAQGAVLERPAKVVPKAPNNNSTRWRAGTAARMKKVWAKKHREREAARAKQIAADLSLLGTFGISKGRCRVTW